MSLESLLSSSRPHRFNPFTACIGWIGVDQIVGRQLGDDSLYDLALGIRKRTRLCHKGDHLVCLIDRVRAEVGKHTSVVSLEFSRCCFNSIIRCEMRAIRPKYLPREMTIIRDYEKALWLISPLRTTIGQLGIRGYEGPCTDELLSNGTLLSNCVWRRKHHPQHRDKGKRGDFLHGHGIFLAWCLAAQNRGLRHVPGRGSPEV
jgi:hypothetical protein